MPKPESSMHQQCIGNGACRQKHREEVQRLKAELAALSSSSKGGSAAADKARKELEKLRCGMRSLVALVQHPVLGLAWMGRACPRSRNSIGQGCRWSCTVPLKDSGVQCWQVCSIKAGLPKLGGSSFGKKQHRHVRRETRPVGCCWSMQSMRHLFRQRNPKTLRTTASCARRREKLGAP